MSGSGDFESTLNSILSSPEQMQKIMGLARSLSGGEGASPAAPGQTAPPAMGELDPKLLRIMTRVLGACSSPKGGDKTALLAAMKPYLREERYASLNQAISVARLARAARAAMTELGGDTLV